MQMVADGIQNGYEAELTRTSRESWASWNQRLVEQGSLLNALRGGAADREEHEVLSELAGQNIFNCVEGESSSSLGTMLSQSQTMGNIGCVECGNTFSICGLQKYVATCRNCREK